MKQLLVILCLIPTLLFSQTSFEVNVENHSLVKEIDGRDITFGVKENVEELLLEKGWILNDSATDISQVFVHIEKVESPHQILNILGTKWLKKSYLITVHVSANGSHQTATGKRNTFIFAAFLDVENNEVPLNRKAFSKALQSALKQSINKIK